MNKKQKKMLIRIIVTFLLLIGLSFISSAGYVRFGLYLVPYLESATGRSLMRIF